MQKFNSSKSEPRIFINYGIRATQVLCIDHLNNNLGVIPFAEAMNIAKENNLDLVQMAPPGKDRPPTVRIIDHGRHKYDLSKKKKEADKRQRENIIKIKEIKFRPTTGDNDLKIKARQADDFLKEGHKVKVSVTFKGREMTHQEVALDTLEIFLGLVTLGELESQPMLDNKNLTVFLIKKD